MDLPGFYERTLDDRNRVVLPAAWRRGDGFRLLIGPQCRCMILYPNESWVRKVRELRTYPGEEIEELLRDLWSVVSEVILDRRGRFVIPECRQQQTGIGRRVVLVGGGEGITIWDKSRWEAEVADGTATLPPGWP